jgi:hypothetical protein
MHRNVYTGAFHAPYVGKRVARLRETVGRALYGTTPGVTARVVARCPLMERTINRLLGDSHSAELCQFAGESMAKRAFGPQLFDQALCLLEDFVVQLSAFEQIPPTRRNFFLGKQA